MKILHVRWRFFLLIIIMSDLTMEQCQVLSAPIQFKTRLLKTANCRLGASDVLLNS